MKMKCGLFPAGRMIVNLMRNLTLGTFDILGQTILCHGGCPVHCRTCN